MMTTVGEVVADRHRHMIMIMTMSEFLRAVLDIMLHVCACVCVR